MEKFDLKEEILYKIFYDIKGSVFDSFFKKEIKSDDEEDIEININFKFDALKKVKRIYKPCFIKEDNKNFNEGYKDFVIYDINTFRLMGVYGKYISIYSVIINYLEKQYEYKEDKIKEINDYAGIIDQESFLMKKDSMLLKLIKRAQEKEDEYDINYKAQKYDKKNVEYVYANRFLGFFGYYKNVREPFFLINDENYYLKIHGIRKYYQGFYDKNNESVFLAKLSEKSNIEFLKNEFFKYLNNNSTSAKEDCYFILNSKIFIYLYKTFFKDNWEFVISKHLGEYFKGKYPNVDNMKIEIEFFKEIKEYDFKKEYAKNMLNEEDEIKNCVCGNKDISVIENYENSYNVYCINCGLSGFDSKDRLTSVNEWNQMIENIRIKEEAKRDFIF